MCGLDVGEKLTLLLTSRCVVVCQGHRRAQRLCRAKKQQGSVGLVRATAQPRPARSVDTRPATTVHKFTLHRIEMEPIHERLFTPTESVEDILGDNAAKHRADGRELALVHQGHLNEVVSDARKRRSRWLPSKHELFVETTLSGERAHAFLECRSRDRRRVWLVRQSPQS